MHTIVEDVVLTEADKLVGAEIWLTYGFLPVRNAEMVEAILAAATRVNDQKKITEALSLGEFLRTVLPDGKKRNIVNERNGRIERYKVRRKERLFVASPGFPDGVVCGTTDTFTRELADVGKYDQTGSDYDFSYEQKRCLKCIADGVEYVSPAESLKREATRERQRQEAAEAARDPLAAGREVGREVAKGVLDGLRGQGVPKATPEEQDVLARPVRAPSAVLAEGQD